MTDLEPASAPSGGGEGDAPSTPTEAAPQPEPETPPKDDSGDELRTFMEEYRADKKAAAEAKAKADAEAAAKKKVPAPEPKKKAAPKPVEPSSETKPVERSYGSARWFNRKPKPVKE